MDKIVAVPFIRAAHRLIVKNPKLLAVYLLLGFMTQLLGALTVKNVLPKYFIFLFILTILGNFAVVYALPYFLYAKESGRKLTPKNTSLFVLRTVKRLLFPTFLLFLCAGFIAVLLSSLFHLSLSAPIPQTHGFGFYLQDALFYSFIEIISTLFLYSPILYTLKKLSLLKSIVRSVKLYSDTITFAFYITLIKTAVTFFMHLFLPAGDYQMLLYILPIEYLSLLTGVATYLYYKDKYTLPTIDEVEMRRERKKNVFLRRIGAFILDSIFVILYCVFIESLLGSRISGTTSPHFTINADTGVWLFLLVTALYPIFTEWFLGGTFGKLLLGIHVTTFHNEPITLRQSLIRNLLRVIDGFPYFIPYLTGLLTIAASDKRQRFGDLIAQTKVTLKEE